ncbi:MAG: hypothetical protein HXS54_14175 [Theionarchaea archaeon]|nr:hypothetical protein [Theionarchaea archaeon]
MSIETLYERSVVILVSFLLIICVILVEMRHFFLAFLIIFLQVFVLIDREYYLQVGITIPVMTAVFYISYTYPQSSRGFSAIFLLIATALVGTDYYNSFLIKRDIKKVLQRMRINYSSIDVLPCHTEYYGKLYHLKKPVAVKVKEKDTIIKGYFDPRDGPFIVNSPQLVPVYHDTLIEVWKTVTKVHKSGTPAQVTYKDKNENTVGIDIYDERTFRVEGWRIRNGFKEVWDPVRRKWYSSASRRT